MTKERLGFVYSPLRSPPESKDRERKIEGDESRKKRKKKWDKKLSEEEREKLRERYIRSEIEERVAWLQSGMDRNTQDPTGSKDLSLFPATDLSLVRLFRARTHRDAAKTSFFAFLCVRTTRPREERFRFLYKAAGAAAR